MRIGVVGAMPQEIALLRRDLQNVRSQTRGMREYKEGTLYGRDVVLVVQNGRAERRSVTVNSIGTDDVVVGAGVAAGEKVVVDGAAGLADGASVREANASKP